MKEIWLVRQTDDLGRITNAKLIMYANEDKAKAEADKLNKTATIKNWDYELFYLDEIN
jgi:hypothetical protein